MNPEIKAAWLTALRSGEYVQGTGTLKRANVDLSEASFCCLGVLCDLAEQAGVVTSERTFQGSFNFTSPRSSVRQYCTASLPRVVMAWSGVEDLFGRYGDGDHESLSVANDEGMSFIDIAKIIEEKF